MPEQPKVDDRILDPARVAHVEDENCGAEAHQGQHAPRWQDVAPEDGEAEHQAREADRREEEAGDVEPAHVGIAHVLDEQRDQRHAEHADRHVDPEDVAPVEEGGDGPADRRPEHRAEQGRDRQKGHRAHQVATLGCAQQQQTPDRHHHRAAGALQYAGEDEAEQRRRQPTADRADRENHDGGAKHRAGAELVRHPARGGDEHRECEKVGRQRQLQRDRVFVQVLGDRRQRRRDHRAVEVLHEERAGDDEGGEGVARQGWVVSDRRRSAGRASRK